MNVTSTGPPLIFRQLVVWYLRWSRQMHESAFETPPAEVPQKTWHRGQMRRLIFTSSEHPWLIDRSNLSPAARVLEHRYLSQHPRQNLWTSIVTPWHWEQDCYSGTIQLDLNLSPVIWFITHYLSNNSGIIGEFRSGVGNVSQFTIMAIVRVE